MLRLNKKKHLILIKSNNEAYNCILAEINFKFCLFSKLMFVPPTPEKDSVISCNVRVSPAVAPICEFPVYIQAR